MAKPLGRVLIIAGSDSGGGAGVQADLKTVTCLGGYAATAITALTAQNTLGVQSIYPIPGIFISAQIESVLSDIGADAFKIGMLHDADVITHVAAALRPHTNTIPLVLDPVMFAKGGAALLQEEALSALMEQLLPLAAIVTPNIPEAEYLAGMRITKPQEMEEAARIIREKGARAVLLKGGHLEGDALVDVLVEASSVTRFEQARIISKNTHGTGCTLASAIAVSLAQNHTLTNAVARARRYVREAIMHAPEIGSGHGPLAHGFTMQKFE